jgi:hypothetical protein
VLLVVVGVAGWLLYARSTGPHLPPGGAAAPGDGAAEDAQASVTVEAAETEFVPSDSAKPGVDYTAVQVTITNTGDEPVNVTPHFFTITDDAGTEHETATALGAPEGELETVDIEAGESATGVIAAEGGFLPLLVTFDDLSGAPVTADVQ